MKPITEQESEAFLAAYIKDSEAFAALYDFFPPLAPKIMERLRKGSNSA